MLNLPAQCMICKHFDDEQKGDEGKMTKLPDGTAIFEYWVCAAFPKPPGIPYEIQNGENDHLEPFPGDHGIQYEKGGKYDAAL